MNRSKAMSLKSKLLLYKSGHRVVHASFLWRLVCLTKNITLYFNEVHCINSFSDFACICILLLFLILRMERLSDIFVLTAHNDVYFYPFTDKFTGDQLYMIIIVLLMGSALKYLVKRNKNFKRLLRIFQNLPKRSSLLVKMISKPS